MPKLNILKSSPTTFSYVYTEKEESEQSEVSSRKEPTPEIINLSSKVKKFGI
jgi:hypothetical protein